MEKLASLLGKEVGSIDLESSRSSDDGSGGNPFRQRLLRVANNLELAEAVTVELGGAAYWRELGRYESRPKEPPQRPRLPPFFVPGAASRESLLEELEVEGFAVVGHELVRALVLNNGDCGGSGLDAAGVEPLAQAVERSAEAGWPAVFVFLQPGAWRAVEGVWSVAAQVLGEDCVLEPTLYAWKTQAVETSAAAHPNQAQDQPKAGEAVANAHANFSLPHRDYSWEESHFSGGEGCRDEDLPRPAAGVPATGRPSLLCAWLPLTDATTSSGCLHALPLEFDPLSRAQGHPDHLRAATRQQRPGGHAGRGAAHGGRRRPKRDDCWGGQFGDDDSDVDEQGVVTEIRFDLGGARALPCPAGSPILWHGNVIHW